MQDAIINAVIYVLASLARVLAPSFQRYIARLCLRLLPDVPNLATTWVVRFVDPCQSGAPKSHTIDAELRQYGRLLYGEGHIQGQPGDPFEYRGTVTRNVFSGTFRRKNFHVLAGMGAFVLKISADSRHMTGRCTWYDSILDDVWGSRYVWTQKG